MVDYMEHHLNSVLGSLNCIALVLLRPADFGSHRNLPYVFTSFWRQKLYSLQAKCRQVSFVMLPEFTNLTLGYSCLTSLELNKSRCSPAALALELITMTTF